MFRSRFHRALLTLLLANALAPFARVSADAQLTNDLQLGSEGAEVTLLQQLLARDQKIQPPGDVNGVYDDATHTAVMRFQTVHNVMTAALGSVDAVTRAYVNALDETRVAASFNDAVVTRWHVYDQSRSAEDLQLLRTALQTRMTALIVLFNVNPTKAGEFALSGTVRSSLPDDLQSLVESYLDVTGTVMAEETDDFAVGIAASEPTLNTDDGLSYNLSSNDPALIPDTRVEIGGWELDGTIVPTSITPVAFNPSAQGFVKNERIAAIMVNFPDLPPAAEGQPEVAASMSQVPPRWI